MNFIQFFLLGILQGITEFIPVSSSGHLVLLESIWNIGKESLLFNTVLHFATLLAILYFLQKKEIHCPLKHLVILVFVGSIPTVIIGLALKPVVEKVFIHPGPVGLALLVTGLILLLGNRERSLGKEMMNINIKDALLIGCAQGLAVLPGISRSGITIVAGIVCGLKREIAAEFSFILVIPAIIGAMGLELWEWGGTGGMQISALLGGGIIALVSGYISLVLLFSILKKRGLHFFAYYCWFVGLLAIVFGFIK